MKGVFVILISNDLLIYRKSMDYRNTHNVKMVVRNYSSVFNLHQGNEICRLYEHSCVFLESRPCWNTLSIQHKIYSGGKISLSNLTPVQYLRNSKTKTTSVCRAIFAHHTAVNTRKMNHLPPETRTSVERKQHLKTRVIRPYINGKKKKLNYFLHQE